MNDYRHGGNIYRAGEKYHLKEKEIIDFSANINPLGFPPDIKNVVLKNFAQVSNYPDPEYHQAIKQLSSFFATPWEYFILSNGGNELIHYFIQMMRPGKVLLPVPTFAEYEKNLRQQRSEIDYFFLKEESDFALDLEALARQLKIGRYRFVFLCNPNNPTGQLIPGEELKSFLRFTEREEISVFIDEAFIDWQEEESMVTSICDYRHVFILRSLTKFFAIPGLRLGFGVGHPEFITRLREYQTTWSVNYFAQLVLGVLLGNRAYQSRSRIFMQEERRFLINRISRFSGLRVFSSWTNFILLKLKGSFSVSCLADRLAREGILIRDCSNFRGLIQEKYFRIAVRRRRENLKLLKALGRIFCEE